MFVKKKSEYLKSLEAVRKIVLEMQKDISAYWTSANSDNDAISIVAQDGSKTCSKCGQRLADSVKACPSCKASQSLIMPFDTYDACKFMLEHSKLKPGEKPLVIFREAKGSRIKRFFDKTVPLEIMIVNDKCST